MATNSSVLLTQLDQCGVCTYVYGTGVPCTHFLGARTIHLCTAIGDANSMKFMTNKVEAWSDVIVNVINTIYTIDDAMMIIVMRNCAVITRIIIRRPCLDSTSLSSTT